MANIKKITSILFVLRIIRMSMSMFTLIFSAKFFGVSVERDVWILATAFWTTICSAVWGPINETFRAKFVHLKEEEGEESAIQRTMSLLCLIICFTLFLSILVAIFVSPVSQLLLQNGTKDVLNLLITLMLLMLPSFLINELINIGISLLNSYEVYYIPEIVGVFSSIINVIIILIFAPTIGIYSLALSQYISIFILLVIIFLKIKKLNIFKYEYISKIRIKLIKPYILYALPFFFPYFVGQCNFFTEKWLAGVLGAGNISSLDYSRQFTVLLQTVLSSILTSVMVPLLAKAFILKNYNDFKNIILENLTVCFLILAIVIPIMFGAVSPLCEFFFLGGKVSVESLVLIKELTQMYSFAFIGVMLYILIGGILLASDQGKRYAFWGVITQIIVLIINISLVLEYKTYIFPVSLFVAHLFAAIVMSFGITKEIRVLLFMHTLKYCFVLLISSICIYMFNLYFYKGENAFIYLLINTLLVMVIIALNSKLLDLNINNIYKKIKIGWENLL